MSKTKPPTPACDKLLELRTDAQLLADFMEFLMGRYTLCHPNTPNGMHCTHFVSAGVTNPDNLVAEFLDIDLDEVEREKRKILEALRNG